MESSMVLWWFSLTPFLSISVSKPKNQRVKRALEARAPKLLENTKTALFIRGGHTSETVTQALKDIVRIYCHVAVNTYIHTIPCSLV